MLKGDLSNSVTPRLLIVFEGLVGYMPKAKERQYKFDLRLHAWEQAVRLFEVNEPMARQIVDATWRRDYAVDIVTFLGNWTMPYLADLLDEWGLPVGNCWAEDPELLARRLSYAPEVAGVFHAFPDMRFTFGSKGYLLDSGNPVIFGGWHTG